eukprot:2395680-Rhodomonas_salina.1
MVPLASFSLNESLPRRWRSCTRCLVALTATASFPASTPFPLKGTCPYTLPLISHHSRPTTLLVASSDILTSPPGLLTQQQEFEPSILILTSLLALSFRPTIFPSLPTIILY